MRGARACRACIVLAILLLGSFSVPAGANRPATSCCADLEDLLSTLTAALSRSDNSERTVRIYGQLNRAVLFWDDGSRSGAYGVDNETSSSRLGLVGKHRLSDELSTGYRIEIDSRITSSSEVSSGDAWGDLSEGAVRLRHAHWYVDDRKLGRLTLGQQSPATDDITIISLGSQMSDAALHYNNSFQVRIPSPGTFRLTWGDLAHTVDSSRGLFVRYDTPVFHGFLLSIAGGEDQVLDAALRYSAVWNSVQVAAGVGVMQHGTLDFRDLRGSLSALHMPSGLFVTLAGGLRHDQGVELDVERDGQFHFAQAGLTRRFLSLGSTTIYGELGRYEDFSVGKVFTANLTGLPPDRRWALTDTTVDRWGFGIEQAIDSPQAPAVRAVPPLRGGLLRRQMPASGRRLHARWSTTGPHGGTVERGGAGGAHPVLTRDRRPANVVLGRGRRLQRAPLGG